MIGRNSNRQKTDTKGASLKSIDDSGNFRRAIISALGADQPALAFTPYGICSNPPVGSLAISTNIQGIASNTVVFLDDPKNRKKGLSEGEIAIVNYLTGAFVFVKSDGGIDIESPGGAKIQLLSNGTISITGNTTINGDLTVTGETTSADFNVPSEPSYVGHKHDGVDAGTETSGGIV